MADEGRTIPIEIHGQRYPIKTALEPEYVAVIRQCRQPKPVADLASDLDLPLGVVRILLSDMREQGLVVIRPPLRNRLTDPKLLKDVADALRKL